MNFDEWTDAIATRVTASMPDVYIKRKIDDLCRWIHNGKECQLHAVSESSAAFVALRADGIFSNRPFSCRIAISAASEEEVARRIIGWFGK